MFQYIVEHFKALMVEHIMTILGLSLICYFGFHMINGNRGLLSYIRLKNEYAELLVQLDTEKTKNEKLENKISLLKDKIDLDLLEELAERTLGLVYKGDSVMIRK